MAVADIEPLAALAVMPTNARESPLQSGDRNRLPTSLAIDAGGQIEANGLRIRGQGVKPLPAQPGRKLPPVGVVSALGVLGTGVAGVIARFFAERREMRRGVPLRNGRAGLDLIIRGGKGGFL